MLTAIATGALAGVATGFVLQRGQLCFHSAIRDSLERRFLLVRGWALGVAIGAVGLAVLFLLPGAEELNRGLAFRPVANISGGLLIGVGMVVARSCVSGLFYKLGSGMLGALVGLGGWAVGELAARDLTIPGPTLLPGGEEATLPGILGLPRLLVAVVLLVLVAFVLLRRPHRDDRPGGAWGWQRIGLGLGAAVTLAWALAAIGGSSFGPSSVGAVVSIADSDPNYWLVAFLLGIVAGGTVGSRTGDPRAGGFRLRGEPRVRYFQLAAGGVLLGAGGWIAGGCNLGHGLSGVAQLSVSSYVVVAAMFLGVTAAAAVSRRLALTPARGTASPSS
ncbi:transporter [Nocardioides psychrotolerans]|uniref:Uncharacterized protein n=1 Tax=Nocardioides psychrotolerans TaxID=1005945 RepID=A0A1I3PF90_9ACTN|nr:YeeE/YedE thiosulfate transporter family protein [Nocardioides psychrotolerans]GEP39666.1 transporter [Nocardioides psychrotolerans]SFJ19979.1 hypothetical protein SAMN05216561_12060 [Nocardioides psychrotolerans]